MSNAVTITIVVCVAIVACTRVILDLALFKAIGKEAWTPLRPPELVRRAHFSLVYLGYQYLDCFVRKHVVMSIQKPGDDNVNSVMASQPSFTPSNGATRSLGGLLK